MLTDLLLPTATDDRVTDVIADSLARGDRWVVGPVAAPGAVIIVTIAPGKVASLVAMADFDLAPDMSEVWTMGEWATKMCK